jgi:hypothetical protein
VAKRKRVRCQLVLDAKASGSFDAKIQQSTTCRIALRYARYIGACLRRGSIPVTEIIRIRTHGDMVVASTLLE